MENPVYKTLHAEFILGFFRNVIQTALPKCLDEKKKKSICISQSCCPGRRGQWSVPGLYAVARLSRTFRLFGKEADSASPILQCQRKSLPRINSHIWINEASGYLKQTGP